MKVRILESHIPDELKSIVAWTLYREEPHTGKKKRRKVPIRPDGNHASSTNPETWSSFDAVWAAFGSDDVFTGLNLATGYQTDDGQVLMTIDLDDCVDTDSIISDEAQLVVDRMNTYTEFSPSGCGLHLFAWATGSFKAIAKPALGFEAYARAHTMSVTGNSLSPGKTTGLASVEPSQIERLFQEYLERRERRLSSLKSGSRESKPPNSEILEKHRSSGSVRDGVTAEKIIAVCRNSRQANKFADLFDDGSLAEYEGDSSAADAALAGIILFYTGDNLPLAEEILRRSALVRSKWDDERDGRSWLTYTLERLLKAWNGEFFDWSRTDKQHSDDEELVLRFDRGTDIVRRSINWLWPGRIPLGKLTLIGADPGVGKSLLTCDLTARITRGDAFPDGMSCPRGDVLIINTEDDPEDTVAPRLDAAGADSERYGVFRGAKLKGRRVLLDVSKHLDELEAELDKWPQVRLIIIDPVGRFTGRADGNRANDMYAVLGDLNELAMRRQIALLAILHFNKAEGLSAKQRFSGSSAIMGSARCAWIICHDPDGEDGRSRLFLPAKANNSSDDNTGLGFSIEPSEDDPDTAIIKWSERPIEYSADEVFAKLANQRGRSDDEPCSSEEFLRQALVNGPRMVTEIKKECEAAGLSFRTVEGRKQKLGVKSKKQGIEGWQWEPPDIWMNSNEGT